MALITASLDAFLFTSLAITVPYIWHSIRSTPSPTSPPLRKPLSILVLLHTLYLLHTILLKQPPNVFSSLGIPLATPTEKIRLALTARAGNEKLPEKIQDLLTRLGSFEVRTFYVRFGHDVIVHCLHCHSFYEHALFALPAPVLQYVRTTFIIGLLTIRGSHREIWRRWGVASVIGAAVCEAWWVSTVAIFLKGDGVRMWHDVLWNFRQAFFLLLPPFFHLILPSSVPLPSSIETLNSTLPQALDRTLTRLRLLKYTKGAIMRVPELRERNEEWWEEERRRGEWIREDEGVRRVAERVGYGFDEGDVKNGERITFSDVEGHDVPGEGRLRTQARKAANMFVKRFPTFEESTGQ